MSKRVTSFRYFRYFVILIVLCLIPLSSLVQGQDKKGYDLSNPRVLGIVSYYIAKRYVDKERINPTLMLKEALAQIERSVTEVLVSSSSSELTVTVNGVTQNFDISEIAQEKDKIRAIQKSRFELSKILKFIQDNLFTEDYNKDLKPEDIEYAAINGMLSTLDPHSQLLVPKVFNEFRIKTEGKFGGLGMVVTIKEDGMLTVVAPLPNTPAWRAGLKARDKILEIDQQSTINMSLPEAVSKLRGKPGTDVTISVMSEGASEAREITITREVIEPPSAPQAEVLEGGIGYIKLTNFQGNTTEHLQAALDSFKKEGKYTIKGLILDLRDNPGGLLDQAVKVADKFLKSGTIVKESVPYKGEEVETARKEGTFGDYPMVVLINGGSASGSEIVAGALKENDRAVLIGGRTFGKGTIQELCNCGDGSALKITVGEYLTPGDISIQEVAIVPDISLIPSVVDKKYVSLFATDSYTREEDLKLHFKHDHDEEAVSANNHDKAKIPSPSHTVRYFLKKEEIAEEEEEVRTPYGKHDLSKDFHVQFARRLLLNATSNKKSEILQNSGDLIEKIAAEEEEKIVAALKKIGIDWSKGDKTLQQGKAEANDLPEPVATLSIDKPGATVSAGEDITLTLTVANKGKGTMYRTVGIIDSKNALFNKREFPLGKIGPGEEKSYSIKFDVSKRALDRADIITVKFKELNGHTPNEISSIVRTKASPRPKFAYTYQIDDAAPSYMGNGDGLIQRGEEIGLLLDIKNIGRGKSEKAIVTLRDFSTEEVYVKKGRAEVKDLAPGGSKIVRLRLLIRKSLIEDKFNLNVIIQDNILREYFSDKLVLYVENRPQVRLVPTSKHFKVNEPIIFIRGGASLKSPPVAKAEKGTILLCDATLSWGDSNEGLVKGEKGNSSSAHKTWFRVRLPNERWGCISLQTAGGTEGIVEVEDGNGEKTKETAKTASTGSDFDGIEFLVQQTPPIIEFDGESLYPIQKAKSLKISGLVKDDHRVRDVYVSVTNNAVTGDKVFLKSTTRLSPNPQRLNFSTDVPLNEGVNLVSIVAIDDRGLFASKSFIVTRNLTTPSMGK